MAFLQGLWAQYGAGITVALIVFVLIKVFPILRGAGSAWLVKRKLPWLVPLFDGAFDFAESIITVSGLGNAKRAIAIGQLTEKLGKAPKGKLLEAFDARLAENAEADRKPVRASMQLSPNGGQNMDEKPFGKQP